MAAPLENDYLWMLFKRLVFCRIFATFYEKVIYVSKYTEFNVLLMYTNDIYGLDVMGFNDSATMVDCETSSKNKSSGCVGIGEIGCLNYHLSCRRLRISIKQHVLVPIVSAVLVVGLR
jgi:hypothetical protein